MRHLGLELGLGLGFLLASACSSDKSTGQVAADASNTEGGPDGATGGAGASGAGGASGGSAGMTTGKTPGSDSGVRDSGLDASRLPDGGVDGAVDASPESGALDATLVDADTDADTGAVDSGKLEPPPVACDSVPVATTFKAIYANLLSVKCVPCHTRAYQNTGTPPLEFPPNQAFDQGPDLAYVDLLDEPDGAVSGAPAQGYACGPTGQRRVVPGDPVHSLIIEKLEGKTAAGAAVCGQRMPYNLKPICQPVIDGVRKWILDGAHED